MVGILEVLIHEASYRELSKIRMARRLSSGKERWEMIDFKVECPHCKKKNSHSWEPLKFGYDHDFVSGIQCEHCEKYYSYEITSEIILEGVMEDVEP